MPVDRFFVDQPFAEGDHVTIGDKRHLKVTRKQTGDKVELVNGRGQLATARLTSDETGCIESIESSNTPPPVIIAQALPRKPRLTNILEKGTELGATAFWLFAGEKSEWSEISTNQIQRMNAVTIGAMKQCGTLHLPVIEIHPPIREWQHLPYTTYYGDTGGAPKFIQVIKNEPMIIVIGPEGGLTQREHTHLKRLGATGVSLHHNTLRTDTASMAALSVVAQVAMPA